MSELVQIEPQYVYVTIPAEYVCVYHRILVMLADYGEEMLKDCKAGCTDKNSGVIECFNMFNAAVAAKKLGKEKLAETLIKYIKAKINQIYKGDDNSTSFVFPVDENGQLKAFVSCGERPKFEINSDDMNLYEHKFGNGFELHFGLGSEDLPKDEEDDDIDTSGLEVELIPEYHLNANYEYKPCADINITYDGNKVPLSETSYQLYFDDNFVNSFDDVDNLTIGYHNFKIIVIYKSITKIDSKDLYYVGEH